MEQTIVVNNVTKKYKLYDGTKDRILDLITPRSYGEDFYALADVSFKAEKGDAIGFIGVNGSGKSTLSNIIAGIVPETSGTVEVNGQAALIAVAAGLKGDLTGRDNIELKCLMLGLSKAEILELEPAIIEFSELGKFIDQPVKSYSSGMRSRLGFSISVNVDPDIIIIDEALSVGDRAFAEKSLAKMKEFKEQDKTMIFVSHSLGQMRQFCEKILWLEFGMVKDFGPVGEIIPKYEHFLNKWKLMSKKDRDIYRNEALEHQERILRGQDVLPWRKVSQPVESVITYREQSISRLGRIREHESYIYYTPKDRTTKESSKKYKGNVFYIKKQAVFNSERFYLLSNEPSAIHGVIGWMKAKDVASHVHVAIDNDPKKFYMKGTGRAYNHAWGSKNNIVHATLKYFKDSEFTVVKTVKVGKNLWYQGTLNDKSMWVHNSHLIEKDTVEE